MPQDTRPSGDSSDQSASSSGARPAQRGPALKNVRRATKVLSAEQLAARREQARAMGLTVVQCHGCFDIVHPGHIRHLKQARQQGDILLVTITSDGSFTKRAGSPLIPEELRAENLAELDCVDWVHVDTHSTAAELLEAVRPDVYVKGREYETNNDPRFSQERSTVERHGGRVVFSSGDVVFSSTALIAMLERAADPYHARLHQLAATPELDGAVLTALVSRFRNQRVLIIGEVMSDVYVLCDRPEVASESPVMTLRPIERRQYDGGAAIIARHMVAMGAKPTLLCGLPAGPAGEAMRQRLKAEGIEVESIPVAGHLAEKQRFLVGIQKVMKLNMLEPLVLDAASQDELVERAAQIASGDGRSDGKRAGFDAAVIADFGNGLLSPAVITRLCRALRPLVRVLAGDVSGRRAGLRAFRDADLLCPSEQEARDGLHAFDSSIAGLAWSLLSETNTRHALLKLGGEGLIAFSRRADAQGNGPATSLASSPASSLVAASVSEAPFDGAFRSRVTGEHVPALSGHPVDPLGCGDALLAAATLALCAGGSILQAAMLGSMSAAAEAQRLGNIPISASDLRSGIVRVGSARLALMPSEQTAGPVSARNGERPWPDLAVA